MAPEVRNHVLDSVTSVSSANIHAKQWQKSVLHAQSHDETPVADKDTKPPKLGDYKQFDWPDGRDGDVVVIETKDGKRIQVSKERTPELFAEISQDAKALDKIHELEDEGYTLRSADDDIPVLGDGDSVTSVTDDDGNLIEGLKLVEVDGKEYIVAEDITPEHFEAASDFQQASSRDDLDDVFESHDLPTSEETNLMGQETTVENDDGEAMTVTELYMERLKQKVDELKTGQDGRHLKVHNNDFYQEHKKEIDTITENWDKWNGSDDIVSRKDLEKIANDEDRPEDEREAAKFLLDDDRSQHFLDMLDTFHEGGDSDGKISNADLDSWMQMIGEREVTEDNPIFERGDKEDFQVDGDELIRDIDQESIDKFEKYVRLLELKSQLDDGSFQFLPYMTVDHGGDWTYYATNTQGMDPADLRGLIDEEKLGQELAELLGDEDIAKFTDEVMTEAQGKIKDRDALADKIYDSLTGDKGADYLEAIQELRDQGLGEEAATRLNNDLNTLQALDPERAAEARGSITAASTAYDLESELGEIDAEFESGDFSAETEKSAEKVANDMLPTILTGITYTTFGIQTTDGVWNAVKDALSADKTDPKATVPPHLSAEEKTQFVKIMGIAAGLKEVIKTAAMSGSHVSEALKDPALLDRVTEKAKQQITKLTTSEDGSKPLVDLDPEQRDKINTSFREQFRSFMGTNTMFAIGGTVALINAIYRRSGDDFGDTPEERMSIARGILVFVGTTPFALKGLTDGIGSHLSEAGKSRLEKLFGTPDLTQALGLDKELGDVFSERFPPKGGQGTPSLNPGPEARGELGTINDKLAEFEDLIDNHRNAPDFQQQAQSLVDDIQSRVDKVENEVKDSTSLSDEEKQQIERQLDRIEDRLDKIEMKEKGLTPQNADELRNLVDDIFNDIRPFASSDIPAEELFARVDDFQNNFDEFKSLIESKSGGKMPADRIESMRQDLLKQQQELRDQINDSALPDDERQARLEALDRIEQGLDELAPSQSGALPDDARHQLDTISEATEDLENRTNPASPETTRDVFQEYNESLDKAAEKIENGGNNGSDDPKSNPGGSTGDGGKSGKKTPIFGPAFKGIAYMTDFAGGILDTVVAGMGLDKAIESGDPLALATSSTGVVSGSFFTLGGAAEIATSVQKASRILTSLGSGLRAAGPIGNLIGLGVGFASLILNAVMAQKKGAETEAKIRDQFEQFAEDGVTEGDWGEKFNYLINSSYGFRDMIHAGDEDKEPDPLFKEWFPEDMAAWEAQPEQYEKFTREIEENGNIDDFFFDFEHDQMRLNIHGQEFYQENKETIDTILKNWDKGDGGSDWTGGDDIVSKDDLKDIASDQDRSQDERDAAQFLLDHEDFFDLLDNLHKQDGPDGKISSADIDSWMQLIGEREITDDNPAFADEDSIWDTPAAYKL